MPIQIANPDVVAKIERLSRITGLGKTAAVEAAVTKMIEGMAAPDSGESWERFRAILSQIQALPVRSDAFDTVELALDIFETVPPDDRTVTAAFNAFVTYGKGSGHSAGLNFGDVFSYALAKTRDLPLLFKGQDFSQTDIR